MKKRQRHTEKGSRRCVRRALVWVIALLLTALAVYLLLSQLPKDDIDVDALLKESSSIPIETGGARNGDRAYKSGTVSGYR